MAIVSPKPNRQSKGSTTKTQPFSPALMYWIQQIREAASGRQSRRFGIYHLDLLEKVLKDFQTHLASRGLSPRKAGLEVHLTPLLQHMRQLRKAFQAHDFDRDTAFALSYKLQRQFADLLQAWANV